MKFTRVNDIVCRVSGYSREELLSMSPSEIITETSRQHLTERADRLLDSKKIPSRAEYQIKTKDGRELWALVTSQFIYENGKPVRASVVISDINNQKKTEAALRVSEEKYRLLVENANDAIFVLQDEQLKFSNRKAKQIAENIGIELERVPFVNHIHPDDRGLSIDRHRRRLNGEKPLNNYAFILFMST